MTSTAIAMAVSSQDDAEAIIKAVAILDCDCLGGRLAAMVVVEEVDVAEQDLAEAVPVIYEPHQGYPLAPSAGIVAVSISPSSSGVDASSWQARRARRAETPAAPSASAGGPASRARGSLAQPRPT